MKSIHPKECRQRGPSPQKLSTMEHFTPKRMHAACRMMLVLVLWLAGQGLGAQTIFLGAAPGAPATCNCLNNASTLTNGQFSEIITITGPAGATWTVSAVNGFFAANSPNPPAAPIPIAIGAAFTEVSPGRYQLSGRHVTGQGFSLTATNGAVSLPISNTCFYPNVQITGLPDTVCLTSLPVVLAANNNGAQGTGSFTINNVPATVFNPQALGTGVHTVRYTFDAGVGSPGNANDPGCSVQVTKQVVVPAQPNTAVNAQINVTLDLNCQALITPSMVMEGNYPCINDFIVTVFNPQGQPIGNLVTGQYAGQTLNVQVMSVGGMFVGTGTIRIFDISAPTITCPTQTNQAFVNNQVQLLNGALTNAQPTFIPSNFACYSNSVAPFSGIHYYQLQTITVSATDIYTFELVTNFPGGGAFGLYQTTFNPFGGPCQNIAGASLPAPAGLGYFSNQPNVVRFTAMLMQGMSYTLLTTSYDGNRTGSYQYAIYSENNGLINGLTATTTQLAQPIYCNSAQQIANNPASFQWTGQPTIVDACMLNPQLTFTDQISNGALCGSATITRTFTVRDQSNNTAQCTQLINLPPISLQDVIMPPKTLILSCDNAFEELPNGNPHPSVSGYPLVITAFGVFEVNPVYCNILGSYSDQPRVQSCQGTSQFIRRWIIFDNCQAGPIISYDQVIRIADLTPPMVSCSAPDVNQDGFPDTLRYTTISNLCSATITVPMPVVADNCSGFTVLTELTTNRITPITNPFGTIVGYDTSLVVLNTLAANAPNRIITNVPVGRHWFRYTVTDDCGNVAVQSCPIQVVDLAPPTAICDDDLVVSLGGNGIGVIRAQDVDEGSSDNCGPVSLEVRRMLGFNPNNCNPVPSAFTPWGPSVNVYCCEVGLMVMVQLRVTDSGGNTNTCTTNIRIIDNTPPICVAPAPVIISCGTLPQAFVEDSLQQLQALFGTAQLIDDCSSPLLQELAPVINRDNCGTGTIIRRFQGFDAAGNISGVCQQLITITGRTEYEIKFPKDVHGDCGSAQTDTLQIRNFGCDMLAISHTDQTFEVPGATDVCYKIFRTYSVINWCEYDGISDAVEVTRDPDCNDIAGETDVWVLRKANNITYIDADNNHTNGLPLAGTRGTACSGQSNPAGYWQTIPSRGYWKYTQVIKVLDSAAPQIIVDEPAPFCSLDNTACTGLVTIPFVVTDDCASSPPVITVEIDLQANGVYDGIVTPQTLSGTFPNYQVRGTYPLGNHRFRVQVRDFCGNTAQAVIAFQVVDCAIPGAFCATGLIIPLMQQPPNTDANGDGIVDRAAAPVNIQNFVVSPLNDCSGPLRYTVHKTADVLAGLDIPAPNHPALVVTCQDIGSVPVRIYTWDAAFNPSSVQPGGTIGGPNYSYCEAVLQVQDNGNFCTLTPPGPVMGQISGIIRTESQAPVSGVEVHPADDMDEMMVTTQDGQYTFEVAGGASYLVRPACNEDWLNGVTTLDIVMTAKHILGIQPLSSPYRIIAADVNHTNTVTTLDLVHMRRLVLGSSSSFPDNTSWRFVWQAFEFPDPINPWLEPFPEAISIPNLQGNFQNGHFVAVKIGDVNGSATANANDDISERSTGGAYYLRMQEEIFEADDEFEVRLAPADAQAWLEGMQFTLQFDPQSISLQDIEWARLGEEHVNRAREKDGILSLSWHAPNGTGEADESDFLILRFRALRNGRLSETIAITSRVTRAEAYGEDLEIMDLALNFAAAEGSAPAFELEQNRPNPFGDQTIIGFFLPESGEVTFRIYDTNGKTVLQYRKHFAAGYNQIMVDAADVAARGLLYYQLATDKYAATKKMVILDR